MYSLLWVAGVEALLSIFSCCLVSVAVLVVMKCSYSPKDKMWWFYFVTNQM
jgi:hypothetical protein